MLEYCEVTKFLSPETTERYHGEAYILWYMPRTMCFQTKHKHGKVARLHVSDWMAKVRRVYRFEWTWETKVTRCRDKPFGTGLGNVYRKPFPGGNCVYQDYSLHLDLDGTLTGRCGKIIPTPHPFIELTVLHSHGLVAGRCRDDKIYWYCVSGRRWEELPSH